MCISECRSLVVFQPRQILFKQVVFRLDAFRHQPGIGTLSSVNVCFVLRWNLSFACIQLKERCVLNKIVNPLVYLGNGKFKWQRDHDLFKEFVKHVLKIKGKWTVPRGGCKQIKTSNITLQLYENESVLLEGSMVKEYRNYLNK